MTWENPTAEEARKIINSDFMMRYKKTLDDMEISNARGYWRAKTPCKGECGMGHTDPLCHTYSFASHGRGKNGRFLRPYRHWEILKAQESGIPGWLVPA